METNNNNDIISGLISIPDAMTNLYQVDIKYNHNLQDGIHSKDRSKNDPSDKRHIVITNNTIDSILQNASYRIPQINIPSQEAATVDISYKSSSIKKVAPGSNLTKILMLPLRMDNSYELYSLFQAACPMDINGITDTYFGDVIQDFSQQDLYKDSKLPSFQITVTSLKLKQNRQYKGTFKWTFHNCIVSSIENFTLDYGGSNALSVNIKLLFSHMTSESLDNEQAHKEHWQTEMKKRLQEQREKKANNKIEEAKQKAVQIEKERKEIYSKESAENLKILSKKAKAVSFEMEPDIQNQIQTDNIRERIEEIKGMDDYLEGQVPQNNPNWERDARRKEALKEALNKKNKIWEDQQTEKFQDDIIQQDSKYLGPNFANNKYQNIPLSSENLMDNLTLPEEPSDPEDFLAEATHFIKSRKTNFYNASIEISKDPKNKYGLSFYDPYIVNKASVVSNSIIPSSQNNSELSLGNNVDNITINNILKDPTSIKNDTSLINIKQSMGSKPTTSIDQKKIGVAIENFSGVKSPMHRFNPNFNLGYGIKPNPPLNSNVTKYLEKGFLPKENK